MTYLFDKKPKDEEDFIVKYSFVLKYNTNVKKLTLALRRGKNTFSFIFFL